MRFNSTPKLREFVHYKSKTLFRLVNRDKMNNRLKARRYQLTRRLISDRTGESLEKKPTFAFYKEFNLTLSKWRSVSFRDISIFDLTGNQPFSSNQFTQNNTAKHLFFVTFQRKQYHCCVASNDAPSFKTCLRLKSCFKEFLVIPLENLQSPQVWTEGLFWMRYVSYLRWNEWKQIVYVTIL